MGCRDLQALALGIGRTQFKSRAIVDVSSQNRLKALFWCREAIRARRGGAAERAPSGSLIAHPAGRDLIALRIARAGVGPPREPSS